MKEVHYFYVPDAAQQNELPQDEATHALRVLRLTSGDELYLMDGNGSFYRAEVAMTSSKHCFYNIKATLPQQRAWLGHLHLAIAPTKDMGRMEWMVEKAVEVGVDEISFIGCKFSERKTIRQDRVERIAIAAMKQSRKAWKPIINAMEPFGGLLRRCTSGNRFICHCYNEIEKADFFDTLSSLPNDDDVTVLVGPEGDFSIDEVKQALSDGFISTSLGSSRLRTETAGLSAVMMMQLCHRIKR